MKKRANLGFDIPILGPEVKTGESQCVACFARMNACVGVTNNNPKIGDLTVCAHCGTVHQFNKFMEAVEAPQDMIDDLKENHQQIWKHVETIRAMYAIAKTGGRFNDKQNLGRNN